MEKQWEKVLFPFRQKDGKCQDPKLQDTVTLDTCLHSYFSIWKKKKKMPTVMRMYNSLPKM